MKIFRGKHWLSPANDGICITAVECSQCGNMTWLGREDGSIHEYNLQSGKLRKTFYLDTENKVFYIFGKLISYVNLLHSIRNFLIIKFIKN